MKILVNFVKKIFNIVFLILSPVRRLICRRRRHSDTPILPLNAVYSAPPTVSTSSLPPEGELQPWESWEMEDSEYKSSRNRNKSENGEQEPDIDFFQDMTPKIKKTAKILVKKDNNEKLENPANRLAMTSEFPVTVTFPAQCTMVGILVSKGDNLMNFVQYIYIYICMYIYIYVYRCVYI
ncbi:receptor-binding cancer antigen expressed on SiSo cells isoform X2 [Octopus bimaculoides]|uniref:receptor-binding cancer antigen expressed on SiSo cells isoform X2 n=1 Tax=Octopus bimaculoides TaxID=37653 RepID=UPI0022E49B9C|nr:receptor-binding cancer antigen expressed on SiSo cells isoform X2 [Octopus bimaculoides]